MPKHYSKQCSRLTAIFLIFTFSLVQVSPVSLRYAFAERVPYLPAPGAMVPASARFTPALLQGLSIHPDNPLLFDFIVDRGDAGLEGDALKAEGLRMIKYFLAALTVPEDDLWVNLSPYENERIIPEPLSQTELGRDMLSQDYLLKQLTASLMYPENALGREFWGRIYQRARDEYGTSEIPVNTFNKVWIVPEQAVVYEHGGMTAVVGDTRLKVMLDEDYLALKKSREEGAAVGEVFPVGETRKVNEISADIVREVIIPELEREVNEGAQFARLRQMYNAMILSMWYKRRLKESLLGKIYAGQNKIKGVDADDKQVKEKIYQQYLDAFRKGVFNYIREDFDEAAQKMVPRKYFSGGLTLPEQMAIVPVSPAGLTRRVSSSAVVMQVTGVELGSGHKPEALAPGAVRAASPVGDVASAVLGDTAAGTGTEASAPLLERLDELVANLPDPSQRSGNPPGELEHVIADLEKIMLDPETETAVAVGIYKAFLTHYRQAKVGWRSILLISTQIRDLPAPFAEAVFFSLIDAMELFQQDIKGLVTKEQATDWQRKAFSELGHKFWSMVRRRPEILNKFDERRVTRLADIFVSYCRFFDSELLDDLRAAVHRSENDPKLYRNDLVYDALTIFIYVLAFGREPEVKAGLIKSFREQVVLGAQNVQVLKDVNAMISSLSEEVPGGSYSAAREFYLSAMSLLQQTAIVAGQNSINLIEKEVSKISTRDYGLRARSVYVALENILMYGDPQYSGAFAARFINSYVELFSMRQREISPSVVKNLLAAVEGSSPDERTYLQEGVLRILLNQAQDPDHWQRFVEAQVPYVWLKDVGDALRGQKEGGRCYSWRCDWPP